MIDLLILILVPIIAVWLLISLVYSNNNRPKNRMKLKQRDEFRVEWNDTGIHQDTIEALLLEICVEFGFRTKYAFRLAPTDLLEDVYWFDRGWTMTDAFDIHFLCQWLEGEFGVTLPGDNDVLRPITLEGIARMMEDATPVAVKDAK